uniref:BI1-like protein n=1 Tax=Zea mays TaxID=4577 RepID=A0A804P0T1_MAIZE
METRPAPCDLEAAVPAGSGAATAAAAQQEAPAAKKVAEEEDPRLRWAFVRKVYAILSLQFALTAAVAATACLVRPIPRFFASGPPAAVLEWTTDRGFVCAVMFPMLKYREKHPRNLVLLAVFTLCCSLSIAVSASTTLGTVVLQATILTAAAVLGLTLFTFWGVKRGYDFTFTFPFLFACLVVLLVYIIIQVCFPLGRVAMTIYGVLATVVFSGFIVYDTNKLLKRHAYNQYVVAAISLYLDVINLFMAQMAISFQ